MHLYPGGCVGAELLSVAFIEGSKKNENGIRGGIAFGSAKAGELGFEMISHPGAVGPDFLNKI